MACYRLETQEGVRAKAWMTKEQEDVRMHSKKELPLSTVRKAW